MGYNPRILERFTDEDEVDIYTFPLANFEMETSGSFTIARQPINGANYGYLHRVTAPTREAARVTFRASIIEDSPADVDTELENMSGILYRVGLGKLWTIDTNSVRRWCWALLEADPTVSWQGGMIFQKDVAISFLRFSDWYASSPTTGSQAVTSTGQNVTINNPGTLPVRHLVLRLRSNTSTGFTNPVLTNETTGYSFATLRDAASSSDEVKLDTEEPSVERSTTDGASYTDDFSQLVIPADHPPLAFVLDPGNNTIDCVSGGTVNFNLDWSFYAAYPSP